MKLRHITCYVRRSKGTTTMSQRLLNVMFVTLLAAACNDIAPTNPFDPESLSPADGRIEGVVLNERFEPMSNIAVTITNDADGRKYEPRTGAKGEWSQDLPPGSYFVTVTAAGFEPAIVGRIRTSAGVRTVVSDVALKFGRGALRGTVKLAGGANPEGTTLTLMPLDGQGTPPALIVAANGEYSVSGMAVGRYKLRASKPEFWPAYSEETSVSALVVSDVPTLELSDGQAIVRSEVNGVIGARYVRERDVKVLLFTFGAPMQGMKLSEDKGFRDPEKGATEHGPYKAETTFKLGDVDGEHGIYAQFRDDLGLETPAYSATVVLDRVKPKVGAMVVGDGSKFIRSLDGSATLSAAASDDLSGVGAYAISIDGAFDTEPWTPVQSNRLEVQLPDVVLALGSTRGLRTIQLKVRDLAGNESDTKTVEVLVDGAAPSPRTPAIVLDDGATTVHALDVKVTLAVDGDDAAEALSFTLGNGAGLPADATFLPLNREKPTISWQLADGEDGPRTVCAKVRDAAGNATEELCVDVALDRTGTLDGVVALEGAPSSLAGVSVTATNDGNPSLLRTTTTDAAGGWKLTGLPGAPGYSLTFARDGYVTDRIRGLSVLSGRAVDAGTMPLAVARGNIAGTVVLVDKQAGESGGISVSALNTPFATTTSPTGDFLLSNIPVGTYEVAARNTGYLAATFGVVTVQAGRTSQLPKIDMRKQSGQFAVCKGTDTACTQGAIEFTKSRDIRLQLTSTTATQYRASVDRTFAGVAYGPLTGAASYPFTIPAGADGSKSIFVQYKSSTGEEQAVLEGSVTLDTAPPSGATVVIDAGDDGKGAAYTNNAIGRVDLTLKAGDSLSGVSTVIVSNDATFDEAPATYSAKTTHFLTTQADGVKTVRVQFCDRVGNCTDATTSALATITLDRAAPSAATGASVVINDNAALTSSAEVTVKITTGDAVKARFGTSESLGSVTWIDVQPSKTLTYLVGLSTDNGVKTVYAQFGDAAGNESQTLPNPFFDAITLDSIAPTGPSVAVTGNPATAPANGFTNAATVPLTLSAQGSPTEMQIALAAAEDFSAASWVAYATSRTVPIPAVGSWKIFARFRDAAGNISATATATIVRDETAPSASGTAVTINEGATVTNNATLRVKLSFAGADLMRLSCTGAVTSLPWVPYAIDFGCTAGAPGTITVKSQFADFAGNTFVPADATIVYDNSPPSAATGVSVVVNNGDALTASTQVTVSVTTGDATRVRIGTTEALTGATWVDVLPSKTVALPLGLTTGDGAKTVYAQFSDPAGNETTTAPNPFSDTITLDTQAPTAPNVFVTGNPAVAPANGYTNQATVPLTLAAQGSPAEMQIVVAALEDFSTATWGAFAVTKSVPIPSVGSWKIFARFRDAAGNVSSTATSTIIRDETAPSAGTTGTAVTINEGASATNVAALRVKLVVAGADLMRLSCSGAVTSLPWIPYATDFSCIAGAPGTITVKSQFSDVAGNTFTPGDAMILYDTTAPGPASISNVPVIKAALPYAFSWTAGANSSDVAKWRVQIADNTAFAPFATDENVSGTSYTVTEYRDGTWKWRVAGLDNAGNLGAWSDIGTFVLDRVAPGVAQVNVASVSETSISLRVLPPGDDGDANPLGFGSSYDLRYAEGTDPQAFNYATATKSTGQPQPKALGQEQTITITGLTKEKNYLVALKTIDEAGNTSLISDVLRTATPDQTAPRAVNDLAAVVGTGKITLSWTTSGDDANTGKASAHTIYYSTGTLLDQRDFDRATLVSGPTPGNPGTPATFDLTGLATNTAYSIAVRTIDEAGNVSGASNIVSSVAYTSVSAVRPVSAGVGDVVELDGINFGPVQGRVLFGGIEADTIVSWSDDLVRVIVPASATPDSSGKVAVGTLVSGRTSTTASMGLSPKVFGVYPSELLLGSPTFVSGSDFGAAASSSRLFLGKTNAILSTAPAISQWVDDAVTFTQASSDPSGLYPLRVERGVGSSVMTRSRASTYRAWKKYSTVAASDRLPRATLAGPDGRTWVLLDVGTSWYVKVTGPAGSGESTFGAEENLITGAAVTGVATYNADFTLDENGTGHFCFIQGSLAAGPHRVYYRTRTAAGVWSAVSTLNLVGGNPIAGAHSNCRISVPPAGSAATAYFTWQVGDFSTGASSVYAHSINGGVSQKKICHIADCSGFALGSPDVVALAGEQTTFTYLQKPVGTVGQAGTLRTARHLYSAMFGSFWIGGYTILETSGVEAATATPLVTWKNGVRSVDAAYAWNRNDGAAGYTEWLARARDFDSALTDLPSAAKKLVDDYGTYEAPRVAGSSDGDLSVFVFAGEGALIRHHLFRSTDGILGADVGGDEIFGVTPLLNVFSAAGGAKAGQVLLTYTNGSNVDVVEGRVPSQEVAATTLSATPSGTLSPIVSTSNGSSHVLYFEQAGATANLRYAKWAGTGAATLTPTPIATWTETIVSRGNCIACDARAAVAARPNGTSSGVWWVPGVSNALRYCADLASCTGGNVVTIDTAPATKSVYVPQITLDSKGTAHIVYEIATVSNSGGGVSRDTTTSDLRYVTVTAAGVKSSPATLAPEPGGKSGAALVVDPSDTLHVFYRLKYGADSIRVRSLSPNRPNSIPTELYRTPFSVDRISAAWSARGIELFWMNSGKTLLRSTWRYGWVHEPEDAPAEHTMDARVVAADDGQIFLIERGSPGGQNRFVPADDIHDEWGSRMAWGRVNAVGYGAIGVDRISGELVLIYFDAGGAMKAVRYRSLGQ